MNGTAAGQPMIRNAILIVIVRSNFLIAQAQADLRFSGFALRGQLKRGKFGEISDRSQTLDD